MKRILTALCLLSLLAAHAQVIDVTSTAPYSPYIFGMNLEHTRSAVNGGLSAQMLKNRKFAGKPAANLGLCSKWFPIGRRVLYMKDNVAAYTRHISLPKMHRWNERSAQVIENLSEGTMAGMGQHHLGIVVGRKYDLRTVTRVDKPVSLTVALTDRTGQRVYASHTISLEPADQWTVSEFTLIPAASDDDADIRYTFTQQAELIVGALSMMPHDNFHGMRSDVVENLKKIGPTLIRWPGGNFAGEYRWKDGLLPVDERAPLQAYTEIETQPHTDGYDYHEIATDDFIALCREVGAEPLLTINLAWQSPEESAQWVEYCNGDATTEYGKIRAQRGHPEPYNVRFWSLGNEMGYGHMEGPNGPDGYTDYALRHADAMLAVTPNLNLFASGPYPNDEWAAKSAARMAEKVKYISLHDYYGPTAFSGGGLHYTTPEKTRATYDAIVQSAMKTDRLVQRMRQSLDQTGQQLHISFDEWNQWYAWYRPSCVGDGIFAARMIHYFLNHSNTMDIPVVCYFQPVGEGAILVSPTESRLTAIGQVFSMMKAHQGGLLCPVADNDDLSTAATLNDGLLTVTLVNERYDEPRTFTFPLQGTAIEAVVCTAADVLPYSYFQPMPLAVQREKKSLTAELPPHSVAMIKVRLRK